MQIDARCAQESDLVVVADLCAAAIAELTPHRGGAVWSVLEARTPPFEESLRATCDFGLLAVSLIDDVIVGYASVELVKLHDSNILGRLSEIFVLPQARGVGCGETLINFVEDWCREQECVGIDSLALPGDRATKNFFETFGLVARAICVHRSLRED